MKKPPLSDREFILSWMLRLQGVLTMLIGLTWLTASTQGRLAGVTWLEAPLSWIPGDVPMDHKVALLWLVAGTVMLIGGFLVKRSKAWENAGFAAGLCWPPLLGLIFLLAFAQGVSPTGWITTISYLNFSVFYAVYLIRNYRQPAPEELLTGPIDTVEGGELGSSS